MTSPGSGPDAADGAPRSGQGRSRRRRRQVHRRSAPPSAQTVAQAGQDGQDAAPAAAAADDTPPATQNPPRPGSRNLPKTFHGSLPSVEDAPFVELTVATSGIHPSTSRMVAFAATFHTADGELVRFSGNRPASAQAGSATAGSPGETPAEDATSVTGIVQQINPGEDPGPWHLHGYTEADLGQAPGFATVAPLLFELIDGRTLICHNTTLTWGFVQFEYRRAQRAANRGNQRNNPRGRRRNQRRPKKIAVPTPTRIIDTLASARRAGVPVENPRLRSIAGYYGRDHGLVLPDDTLPQLGPIASLERADVLADDLLLADTRTLFPLADIQRTLAAGTPDNTPGGLAVADPADLTADRFGLQRSTVRVDATTSPRPFGNPGTPDGAHLVQGMEVVVSPDVGVDPDVLISAATRAGLVYSEKLNRTSSLVVCNRSHELRGKAMHGERKNIPLFTDDEFLAALNDVAAGSTEIAVPDARPATPRIPAPQRGKGRNQGRNQNRNRSKTQSRGGRGRGGQGGKSAGQSGQASDTSGTDTSSSGPSGTPAPSGKTAGDGSGRSSSTRRRRRRGSGRSGGGNQNRQKQNQNQKPNQKQG
ncbi:DNA polymerase III subunit epsilon [Corynebacterium sp.]|uniref:DNA polymerase III subunit epsilon n=1 Tax=Corynebacterium sp. TaxID=1720 RepID=UPI003B3A53F2